MPPGVPGPDAAAWQRVYEQELLPRFSVHQRRVKRRFHVFVVIAVASAAFALRVVFAEHSSWWLLLPLVLTFSAGLIFVEGFLTFQRRYLDEVMAPWLTLFWPTARYQALPEAVSDRLGSSGLFALAPPRWDVNDRISIPSDGLDVELWTGCIRRRVSNDPNNVKDETVFEGILFEVDLPWPDPVRTHLPLAIAADGVDLPPAPGGVLPFTAPLPPWTEGQSFRVWAASEPAARRVIPSDVAAALEALDTRIGHRWRLVLDERGLTGALALPAPASRLYVKAPLPTVTQLLEHVGHLAAAIEFARVFTPHGRGRVDRRP